MTSNEKLKDVSIKKVSELKPSRRFESFAGSFFIIIKKHLTLDFFAAAADPSRGASDGGSRHGDHLHRHQLTRWR